MQNLNKLNLKSYNMKVVLYGQMGRQLEDVLKANFPLHAIESVDGLLTEANTVHDAEIIVIKYNPSVKISSSILDKMPKLKAIVAASTGMDHVDIEECKRRGITVKNCPTYAANAVAELALALVFFGMRGLAQASRAGGLLDYSNNARFSGIELQGKTCAVLGTGNIGALVCEKMLPLGCTVVAYDIVENHSLEQKGVRYMKLNDALSIADVVILTLPLVKGTYHILGGEAFSLMKDGAGIVNVGRGALIDNAALYNALGRLSFAVLDVVEGEDELVSGKKGAQLIKLSQHPKVILTPHIGARTREAENRMVEQIVGILRGLLPSA